MEEGQAGFSCLLVGSVMAEAVTVDMVIDRATAVAVAVSVTSPNEFTLSEKES